MATSKPLILGLSASLRNARSKDGSKHLIEEMIEVQSRDALFAFLEKEAQIHLEQFIKAGRAEGAPFDEMYRELKRAGGDCGLSNSEIGLVAALWGARMGECDVEHISLADHFPANGALVDVDALKARVRQADAIILATPVYFGDRSSLSQRFIDTIRDDRDLQAAIEGKIYAGIAVGAKRNGGQETTLIYQMMDMLNLGFLAVGNDSDTTSQYGGTIHAGDVGTGAKDAYGLDTSIGTGRRVARVCRELAIAKDFDLVDRPRLAVWSMQDKDGLLDQVVGGALTDIGEQMDVQHMSMMDKDIRPCIACDVCPTHVGPDGEYRCIIKRKSDGMVCMHEELLQSDILMPMVSCVKDRDSFTSVYQLFMERTRYLRRGDYVFSDFLVAPVVVSDIEVQEHMDIRMATSFIRHHTIIHKPIMLWLKDGKLINPEALDAGMKSVQRWGAALLKGRLAFGVNRRDPLHYNPVGYVLSAAKDREDQVMDARRHAIEDRDKRIHEAYEARLQKKGLTA